MSRKTLVISEDGMFANEPLPFSTIMQLVCSCVAGVATDVIARAKEKDEEEAKAIEAELFDTANLAFSNCLDVAFPGIALRPDLTEEAILKAENDILSERAAEIEPDAGEPEKIVPFPAKGNPEPAGTYNPNEGTCVSGVQGSPVKGDAE